MKKTHTGNMQLLELFQQLKKNPTTSMYNYIGFYENLLLMNIPGYACICSQLRFEFTLKIIKSMIYIII